MQFTDKQKVAIITAAAVTATTAYLIYENRKLASQLDTVISQTTTMAGYLEKVADSMDELTFAVTGLTGMVAKSSMKKDPNG